MRVALISTIQTVTDGDSDDRCAFAYIAGRSVAERQIHLALSMGCERIACIADTMSPEVVSLQHITERADAKFHIVRRVSDLAGLISATNDVLALADGLFVEPDIAENLASNGRFIAALPVDVALEAGFERIDREWGWAGMMLVPGHLVDQLADLPPDSDPIATLLRIALQSQVKVTPVETSLVTDKRLALAGSDEHAGEVEAVWLRNRVDPAGFTAPTRAITDRIGLRWGGDWLARGIGSMKIAMASLGLASISAAASWFLNPIYGLAGAVISGAAASLTASIALLESDDDSGPARVRKAIMAGATIAIDGVIVIASTLLVPADMRLSTLFAAIILLGLARLAKNEGMSGFLIILADRIVLTTLIIAASLFGLTTGAMQVLALMMLGALFMHNRA